MTSALCDGKTERCMPCSLLDLSLGREEDFQENPEVTIPSVMKISRFAGGDKAKHASKKIL